MNDYLTIFEQYQDIKGIADLIDDVKKLREYYSTQQYDKMHQHIDNLMCKYVVETVVWNSTHNLMPVTVEQSYINAESFLWFKGFSILLKKGINIQEQLSSEEIVVLEKWFNPEA